ncbi:MAG: hypothetical protein V1897_03985, partial [Pseudomonadota bacterium]
LPPSLTPGKFLSAIQACRKDTFFSTFGPGNLLHATDRPFERFRDYEDLLQLLHSRNPQKYEQVHKGTPFFFLAWLAFDLRNYEKALYYLDAAISEDVRNAGANWTDRPGALFLRLTTDPHVAERVIRQIRQLLSVHIDRFNVISGLAPLSIDVFIDRFVVRLMQTASTRTVISALYVFLLEAAERLIELRLKSIQGGSLGPVIAHLFSAGLVFESLLKYLYPTKNNGDPVKTLGQVFQTNAFISDFGTGIQTSADSLQDILDAATDNSLLTAFCTASKLRNTTGHNLVWDNIFHLSSNYEVLVDQSLNALLYLIERKFIR